MAYDVSTLVNYVKQEKDPLLRNSLFKAKTSTLVNIQAGIKSAQALEILSNTIFFQADGCSFDPSGTTTFSQRTITVGKVKVQQEFCPKALEAKFTQLYLNPGSLNKDLPVEAVFMGLVTDQISAALETAVWQGDTVSGTGNLSFFDGFITIMASCPGYVTGNTTSITSVTSSNIISIVDSVYSNIPTNILDKTDTVILMGFDTYRLYTIALKNSNLYNYPVSQQDFELVVPGTNVKIIAVNGLNGTNKIFATQLSNLYIGVDLESDSDDFDLWYSQDFRTVRMSVEFKYGTQIAFCQNVVYWHL